MRYIHNFDTVSAFTEEYTGSGYTEPWVSYTKENRKVDYNYVPEVTLVNTWSWWDETTGDKASTSVTITLKNLEISCSDLVAFSENGMPEGASKALYFNVYDKNENLIYEDLGGKSSQWRSYDALTDCEKCDFLYNETPIPNTSQESSYVYDADTGKFNPILDGLTISVYWQTWK